MNAGITDYDFDYGFEYESGGEVTLIYKTDNIEGVDFKITLNVPSNISNPLWLIEELYYKYVENQCPLPGKNININDFTISTMEGKSVLLKKELRILKENDPSLWSKMLDSYFDEDLNLDVSSYSELYELTELIEKYIPKSKEIIGKDYIVFFAVLWSKNKQEEEVSKIYRSLNAEIGRQKKRKKDKMENNNK